MNFYFLFILSHIFQALKSSNVRVSMIGLAADVRVCRHLCVDTRGRYDVILDESHFKDLLNSHVAPPPASVSLL